MGGACVGGITYLVQKIWEKSQKKALEYLLKIIENLNKLNTANLMFMDYLNRSKEDACKILTEVDDLKNKIKLKSKRYRKSCAEICTSAIESTNGMIEAIDDIDNIGLMEFVNQPTLSLATKNLLQIKD